jgi:putative flippase GtrA
MTFTLGQTGHLGAAVTCIQMNKLIKALLKGTGQSLRYVILGIALNLASISISTALCAMPGLLLAAPVAMLISATALFPLGYLGSTRFVYRVKTSASNLRRYAVVYFTSLALFEAIALVLSLSTSLPEALIPLFASAIGFSVSMAANTLWSFSKKKV